MRTFESGRKVHAYDIPRKGCVLYIINLDDSCLNLAKLPGYISIDADGKFLCASNPDKILIWNALSGKFIQTIEIPAHYDFRKDEAMTADKWGWKSHSDFSFAEDKIIIIHSHQNFPIAADVMLFW